MEIALPRQLKFGAFEFDVNAGELRKGTRKVLLQEQPFQILRLLVERRGGLVTREEIRKKALAEQYRSGIRPQHSHGYQEASSGTRRLRR